MSLSLSSSTSSFELPHSPARELCEQLPSSTTLSLIPEADGTSSPALPSLRHRVTQVALQVLRYTIGGAFFFYHPSLFVVGLAAGVICSRQLEGLSGRVVETWKEQSTTKKVFIAAMTLFTLPIFLASCSFGVGAYTGAKLTNQACPQHTVRRIEESPLWLKEGPLLKKVGHATKRIFYYAAPLTFYCLHPSLFYMGCTAGLIFSDQMHNTVDKTLQVWRNQRWHTKILIGSIAFLTTPICVAISTFGAGAHLGSRIAGPSQGAREGQASS